MSDLSAKSRILQIGFSLDVPTLEDNYDYLADDAEAVIYIITMSTRLPRRNLFVMHRADAVRFCSDPRTAGQGYGGAWAYAFTTHNRDWRDNPDEFRQDDGRMDAVLNELGINLIYRGGQPIHRTSMVLGFGGKSVAYRLQQMEMTV